MQHRRGWGVERESPSTHLLEVRYRRMVTVLGEVSIDILAIAMVKWGDPIETLFVVSEGLYYGQQFNTRIDSNRDRRRSDRRGRLGACDAKDQIADALEHDRHQTSISVQIANAPLDQRPEGQPPPHPEDAWGSDAELPGSKFTSS